ncbi:MAG: hypothetical protein H6R26_603 [Proteobacteria bacterium]|nr:hypothetical protein [Pseudomonadota bacterium]
MPILKEILLRYRGEGHVRFDIPASLCTPEKAASLSDDLHRLEGVYRVDISRRNRKLSVRYMPMVVDFDSLITSLGTVVKELELTTPPSALRPGNLSVRSVPWVQRLDEAPPVRWAKEKLQEARETAAALKIVVRRAIHRSAPEHERSQLLISFLNDLLAFYLITVHWKLMTRYWLRRPWEYRYQWLSSFYLLFLLIRSKQSRLR